LAGRIPNELIERFLSDCGKLDTYELAQRYHKSQSTIREWKQQLRREGHVIPIIMRSAAPVLPEPITVDGRDALILSDLHIPYLNVPLYEKAIRVARNRGIGRVVIAGDLVDFGSISSYPGQTESLSVREELRLARERLEELEDNFEEVICLTGNHDARLAHHLGGGLGVADLGLPGVWSDHWYCYIGSWMIVHPVSYSEKLAVTRDLADIYGMNVIAGHTHQWGITKSRSGKYEAVEIGCMCLESATPYKALRITRYARWVPGFAILQNDVCYLYDMKRAEIETGEEEDG